MVGITRPGEASFRSGNRTSLPAAWVTAQVAYLRKIRKRPTMPKAEDVDVPVNQLGIKRSPAAGPEFKRACLRQSEDIIANGDGRVSHEGMGLGTGLVGQPGDCGRRATMAQPAAHGSEQGPESGQRADCESRLAFPVVPQRPREAFGVGAWCGQRLPVAECLFPRTVWPRMGAIVSMSSRRFHGSRGVPPLGRGRLPRVAYSRGWDWTCVRSVRGSAFSLTTIG